MYERVFLPSSVTSSSNKPSATRYASNSLWNKRINAPPYKKKKKKENKCENEQKLKKISTCNKK